MDAFTHSLLERDNLAEIECWHEIAHEACQLTHDKDCFTLRPHEYWFWADLYWDTIEIVRAIRYPNYFELDTSQVLNEDQLISTLNHVGLRVITFE